MNRRSAHSKRNNRLNVLIAGAGGCGKSTLINALCNGHGIANTVEWLDIPAEQAIKPRPLKLRTYTEDLTFTEFGTLTFRMVETQGMGENLDNNEHIDGVVKYIEGQFDEVLAEESRIRRNPRFTDSRVHAVVYMIEPTGHGLREQDVKFMQRVSEVANIIPVLAKSDTLTHSEVLTNKRLVYEDIEYYKIPIYQFFDAQQAENADDSTDQTETYLAMRKLQESLPFAIMASNKVVKIGDKYALVREYPWGTVNITDPKVSDFTTLKDILLYSHMEDLKETTNDTLYERYRTLRLSEDPSFNAAVSAASAPITASRANLAAVARQPAVPPLDYARKPVYTNGVRTSSGQEYVNRENRLIEEEELLHRDEKLVQSELELRKQELRRRELELRRLEERLRQETEQLNAMNANKAA